MRNTTSVLALLLCAACVAPAAAQPANALVEVSPPSLLAGEEAMLPPRGVSFGMTPKQVLEAMRGRPDAKPADDLWVYWHFYTAADPSGKFNTLVLYFNEGRLTKFRLVERKALAALLNEVRKARVEAVATK